MNKNEIIAFALSPLLPVLLFSLGIMAWGFNIAIEHGYGSFFSVISGLAILGLIVSYAIILLFVMPIYYVFLKRSKVTKLNIYTLAGVTGSLIITVVSIMFGAHSFVEFCSVIAIGFLLGISAGYTFFQVINFCK